MVTCVPVWPSTLGFSPNVSLFVWTITGQSTKCISSSHHRCVYSSLFIIVNRATAIDFFVTIAKLFCHITAKTIILRRLSVTSVRVNLKKRSDQSNDVGSRIVPHKVTKFRHTKSFKSVVTIV